MACCASLRNGVVEYAALCFPFLFVFFFFFFFFFLSCGDEGRQGLSARTWLAVEGARACSTVCVPLRVRPTVPVFVFREVLCSTVFHRAYVLPCMCSTVPMFYIVRVLRCLCCVRQCLCSTVPIFYSVRVLWCLFVCSAVSVFHRACVLHCIPACLVSCGAYKLYCVPQCLCSTVPIVHSVRVLRCLFVCSTVSVLPCLRSTLFVSCGAYLCVLRCPCSTVPTFYIVRVLRCLFVCSAVTMFHRAYIPVFVSCGAYLCVSTCLCSALFVYCGACLVFHSVCSTVPIFYVVRLLRCLS